MSKAITIEETTSIFESIRAKVESFDRREWFLITTALAFVVFVQFQFWKMPSITDRANWDYMAQEITRGAVPYRDVVNIKSPLSAYIGAVAIFAGRLVGVRDIFAIRFVYVLLAALTVSFTFLVARDSFDSRRIGLLSALIMMAFTAFVRLNSGGVQPKTPMVLFGLVCLWLTMKDRPFLAGVFGMLSALSWQPGLMFVGAAGLGFSRYLRTWRDLKVVKLLAGAVLPLAILMIEVVAAHAVRDFYIWNIDFNFSVYAIDEMRSLYGFFKRLNEMLKGSYYNGHLYFFLAVIGLVAAVWREIARARREGRQSLFDAAPRHGVLICPVVYFIFCMIDIQGGADMIPFLPFVAILSAVAIGFAFDELMDLLARRRLLKNRYAASAVVFASICATILLVDVVNLVRARTRSPNLADQQAEVSEIVSFMQPGDKIYVHGIMEILVLSGLPNCDKHFFVDRGKDMYLDKAEPGGFDGWFARLKAQRPRIVALERLKWVRRKDAFLNWVAEDYVKREGKIFTYYVRKDTPGAADTIRPDRDRKRKADADNDSSDE
jgi:hypothetical protein